MNRWTLENFAEALDRWIDEEHPSEALRIHVTTWIFTRFEDPYQGVRREPGFPNLWFGAIPGSTHEEDHVVACAYWIREGDRTVRCDSFATLGWPV